MHYQRSDKKDIQTFHIYQVLRLRFKEVAKQYYKKVIIYDNLIFPQFLTFPVMEKFTPDSKEYLQKLGDRIKELRLEKGIKQVDLGYAIDVEKPNMRRIEAGGNNLSILALRKIAAALQVTIKDLIPDE